MLLKRGDAFLQQIDLVDGALKRQAERVHRALQSLEEVDLHHRDEDALAALLGESAEDLVLIGGANVAGRSSRRKLVGWYRASRSELISVSSCSKDRKRCSRSMAA